MHHPFSFFHYEYRNYFFVFIRSPQQMISHVSIQPHSSSTETIRPHTLHEYLSPGVTSFFFLPACLTIFFAVMFFSVVFFAVAFFTVVFFAAASLGLAATFFVATLFSFL